MPKFSILMPVIKGRFLDDAIKSVLNQTFSDWELIIYDDFSPDDIAGIVNKYEDDRMFFSRGKKNLGKSDPSMVWNKILKTANGDYICLLGDDDIIANNYLEEMHKLISKYPGVSVFRAKLKRIDEKGKVISEVDDLSEFETWDQSFYARNVGKRMQSTSEFVIKKESLDKIGGYVNFPRACGSDDATYILLSKDNGIASTNNTSAFWRKSSLNISDNDSQEVNEYKIRFLLKWEKDFLNKFFSLKVPLGDLYGSIEEFFVMQRIRSELDPLRNELSDVKKELAGKINETINLKNEINSIHSSHEWKAVLILKKVIKVIIPKGGLRRRVIVIFWKLIKAIVKSFFRIINKIREYVLLCRAYFLRLRPRKKRKLNKDSKKIAYIGHSYHNKTKSSEFLLDYLKQFYDIEIIYDDSWQGSPYPDLSFIDESYLGVIFFQLLPSQDILKSIKNDNIIHFPMYDQSGGYGYGYWRKYWDLKIVNFSKTLQDKLEKWGFETIHVQYFPKFLEFSPGKKDEVFFWQRLTKININIFEKLFGDVKMKLHIHKSIDPGQEFIEPTKEQEEKYNISYSEWFDTREEMQEVIKQKGIYVAPREFEGIGMSFLEAMAMGKAVVAVNNPTMNEYIEHGKTGYLFDLKNPKKIDFSNIEEVQKNTYDYMKAGYEKWESEKHRIIDFIEKE